MMAALMFLLLSPELLPMPKELPGDLSGVYWVEGHDNKGPYDGVAWLKGRGEGVYMVQWSGEGESVVGVGLRTGDTLSVGWVASRGEATARGVTVYRIHARSLVGRWVTLPGKSPGRETLTILKPLEVE
jgi:hypothetical protein